LDAEGRTVEGIVLTKSYTRSSSGSGGSAPYTYKVRFRFAERDRTVTGATQVIRAREVSPSIPARSRRTPCAIWTRRTPRPEPGDSVSLVGRSCGHGSLVVKGLPRSRPCRRKARSQRLI